MRDESGQISVGHAIQLGLICDFYCDSLGEWPLCSSFMVHDPPDRFGVFDYLRLPILWMFMSCSQCLGSDRVGNTVGDDENEDNG